MLERTAEVRVGPIVAPIGWSETDVAVGFTTREDAAGGLDLRAGLPREALDARWSRVCASLHPALSPDRVAVLNQVHGAEVVQVRAPGGSSAPVATADAAVTDVAGLALVVRVADCVPLLFAAPGAIGVAHSGWRGAAAGVVPATVRALCALASCYPSALRVVIGPHISAARFEVGDEVVEALAPLGPPRPAFVRAGPRGRPHVDLLAVVAHQLEVCGVRQPWVVPGCTWDDARWFSVRRDGADTGRFAGVIAMVPR